MVHYFEKLMGVVVFAMVQEQVKFEGPRTLGLLNFVSQRTFVKLLLQITLRSNNIPAKNSTFYSFSTLLNHQNMILDVSENSWVVMFTTPQFLWTVMKIIGW